MTWVQLRCLAVLAVQSGLLWTGVYAAAITNSYAEAAAFWSLLCVTILLDQDTRNG